VAWSKPSSILCCTNMIRTIAEAQPRGLPSGRQSRRSDSNLDFAGRYLCSSMVWNRHSQKMNPRAVTTRRSLVKAKGAFEPIYPVNSLNLVGNHSHAEQRHDAIHRGHARQVEGFKRSTEPSATNSSIESDMVSRHVYHGLSRLIGRSNRLFGKSSTQEIGDVTGLKKDKRP